MGRATDMADPAATAQRQQTGQTSLLWQILTLPFRWLGVLCGSLVLSVLIEAIGMLALWPEQGWHHAQAMFDHELAQLSADSMPSLLVHEPARTAHRWAETVYTWIAVKSGLLAWVRAHATATHQPSAQGHGFTQTLGLAYAPIASYLLAAVYTVLTFVVRVVVLLLSAPLFALAAFAGLVDGLVRRDIRRFGAGRESGFLHHRAKATVVPLAVFPWITYLALPVSLDPMLLLVPSAALLFIAVDIAMGSFKKYL